MANPTSLRDRAGRRRVLRALAPALLLAAPALAQDPPTDGGVDLSDDSFADLGEAAGQVQQGLDRWFERFEVFGFLASRYMQTDATGNYPDGALGVHQALMFFQAELRDTGTVVVEVEWDWFRDNDDNGVGANEVYLQIHDPFGLGDENGDGAIGLKAGRFNLPFGEYYFLEDAPRNRLVSIPLPTTYRWDEGIQLFQSTDDCGWAFSFTEGTYDRQSSTGISPAFTGKVWAEPNESLFLSASCHWVQDTPASALCFGGSVLTPVTGGAGGASPSTGIDALVGAFDGIWQPSESFQLQWQLGGCQINDIGDQFDREFGFWIVEPSVVLNEDWTVALRYSGVSTFDSQEGYQFEGQPYFNGMASYGFDLMQAERLSAGVVRTFAPGLLGKIEVGFDHARATDLSGLADDTRKFVAAELVLAF